MSDICTEANPLQYWKASHPMLVTLHRIYIYKPNMCNFCTCDAFSFKSYGLIRLIHHYLTFAALYVVHSGFVYWRQSYK